MTRLPPSPAQFRSTEEWARQFYEFYISETRIQQDNDPLPVQLPHRTDGIMERATTPGVLLYDPIQKTPVYSENNIWNPIAMDYGVFLAEQEILSTYGDTVSVADKSKTLLKFGNNADLDTADGFATIWQLGKEAGTESEVYPNEGTNPIDSISSTDAADTTQEIYLEGHVSDGNTGADENFTFTTETVALNGQTRVALANSYARISEASVVGGATVAGDVHVYENTALTSGKPTDITKAHISIEGTNGETRSYKAATTFSSTDYFILTKAVFTVKKDSGSAVVDFRVAAREVGSVFRRSGLYTLNTNQPTFEVDFYPYRVIPKNSDVIVEAATNTNNTQVSASFQGFLAKVQT